MPTHYVECQCSSNEHVVRFSYDDDENIIYVEFFLSELPWMERVIRGLKYIFGYKCKYGHWEEVVWDKESSSKVYKMLGLINRDIKT